MAGKKKVNVLETQTTEQSDIELSKATKDELFAKAKKQGKAVSKMLSVKPSGTAKCDECSSTYTLKDVTNVWFYPDGTSNVVTTTLPKHGRCDKCQTIYIANLRANKFFTACKHIGNMNNRLTHDEKQALIAYCEQQFSEQIISRLTGDKIAAVRFNLAKA